jgi:type III restriction enzyme
VDVTRPTVDYVEYESANAYERAIAICIDEHPEVLWWYRNLVGKDQFAIQGYRRNRIWPDFVVQSTPRLHKPVHRVLVIEGKGKHLEGNPDTTYKRSVASYFDGVGKKVSWQRLGEDFKDHVFRFQILDEAQDHGRDWKDELQEMLAG